MYTKTWFNPETGRWVAMAKKTPFITDSPLFEPGTIYTVEGDERDQALKDLLTAIHPELEDA